MTTIEKELREALELMDGVPIAGRENRMRIAKAEAKILAVADAMKMLKEKAEKEVQAHDEDHGE